MLMSGEGPTCLCACRQDRGQVEDLGELRMRKNVALHDDTWLVPSDLKKTFLMVDNQKDCVVLVEPLIRKRANFVVR